MKRTAAVLLLLIYFTVTTGFVVSVHYCMGKLSSVELGYDAHGECGKCGMAIQKSDGCCKDDVKLVKMHVDHNAAKTFAADFSLALPPLVHSGCFTPLLFSPAQLALPLAHGPPLGSQDTYLRNCVFRL